MKAVVISIRPKWVEKIANGEKTIEVRKTAPKIETPVKCYIYMTQGKLKELGDYSQWIYENRMKVIGEFICDKILTIDCDSVAPFCKEWDRYVDKETCLTAKELFQYSSYICKGWHISDLKIYDKPKELSEFAIPCNKSNAKCITCKRFMGAAGLPFCNDLLTRPPQSWCYVEELGERK